MKVILELAVGEAKSQVSLADADAIVAAAQDAGVTAIRLLDRAGEHDAIDPSVVAAHLAGRYTDIGWIIDAPTTHNAPYNLARRILSIDRATGGRVAVTVIAGDGDEVSDAETPDREAIDPAQRWAEYAQILTALWESFPSAALIGDQEREIVAEDTLIRSIDFDGRFYRVAGPLDGPSSVQGRPVLVAADPATVGWSRVAAVADAVILDLDEIDVATTELRDALQEVGRRREEVAVLARTEGTEHLHTLQPSRVDAVVLAPDGGARGIFEAVRSLVLLTSPNRHQTLRSALAIPVPESVLA